MSLVVFHTKRVREALKRPAALGPELLFLFVIAGAVGLLLLLSRRMAAPYSEKVFIDLRFWALPKYTMLSLARGFAAYVISLLFTLVYGTIAAHNQRAEKLMLPALDVLQAIPVLGFLPGLVLAMVHLFPTREMGLEIACVIMIFTAQAWNMTFSFHGSLRAIPSTLREVAAINHFSDWQIFKSLEVPAAMIGLVWNSMMSMAGGWFFLTVNEAFQLGSHDYRLPGIGSYMQEAIDKNDTPAKIAAVIAMIVMIVVVDQVFWRPIVVWAQRFKMDELAQADPPQSWVLNILEKSQIYAGLHRVAQLLRPKAGFATRIPTHHREWLSSDKLWPRLRPVFNWSLSIGAIVCCVWGGFELARLLVSLPLSGGAGHHHQDWIAVGLALLASFGRTTSAVALGAAWTLPVGILIGRSRKWSERLQPIIQVVASFPAPMLFPLVTELLFMMHIPFTIGCTSLMLLGAQWYVLFNVIAGASAIPHDLGEVTTVYRMSQWQMWTKLYIPCVFPYLVTGLITAAGGAWNATIVAEYVENGRHIAFGLGSLISDAQVNENYPLLAAGVVTMAVFVVLLNRFFWKRLYRLVEERYSLNM